MHSRQQLNNQEVQAIISKSAQFTSNLPVPFSALEATQLSA
jgi:hypothetical protein